MMMKKFAKNHRIFLQNSYVSIQNHYFFLFSVNRWSKKCCKIVHFHRKFIEKFVIFQRKNHVFTNPGVQMVSTTSLIFHSKIVILIQNPRFPRSRCTDDCIFIQNGMKNGRCSWKINSFIKNASFDMKWCVLLENRWFAWKTSLLNECGPPRGAQPRNLS